MSNMSNMSMPAYPYSMMSGYGSASGSGPGIACWTQNLLYEDGMFTVTGGNSTLLPAADWPSALGTEPNMCPAYATHCILLVFPPEVPSMDMDGGGSGMPPPQGNMTRRRLLNMTDPPPGQGSGMPAMWPTGLHVTGTCYDPHAEWVQENGVNCMSDDLGFALDGSFAYICCHEPGCNDQMLLMDKFEEISNFFAPDCLSDLGMECVERYAESFGCLRGGLTLPRADECAPFVREGSCLKEFCGPACSCEMEPSPQCEEACEALEEDYAAPGCPSSYIADGMCDLNCMWEDALYDAGDCGQQPTSHFEVMRQFALADTNRDHAVDLSEFSSFAFVWTVSEEEFGRFAKLNPDGPEETLDDMEFFAAYLRFGVMTMWEPLEDILASNEPMSSGDQAALTLRVASELFFWADKNMDGVISRYEAEAKFGLSGAEYDFLGEEEDVDLFHVADLYVALVSSLKGAFAEEFGYDMGMASGILVKMADLNGDMMMSRTEATVLRISPAVFEHLDLNGDMLVHAEEMVTVLRTIGEGGCGPHGFRIVGEYEGALAVQLPLLRPATCTVLVQPGWNYPRPYTPAREPVCNASTFDMVAGPGGGSGYAEGSGMRYPPVEDSPPPEVRRAGARSATSRVRAAMRKGLHRPNSKHLEPRSAVVERSMLPETMPNAKKQAHAKKRAAALVERAGQGRSLHGRKAASLRRRSAVKNSPSSRARSAQKPSRAPAKASKAAPSAEQAARGKQLLQRYLQRVRTPRRSTRHLKLASREVGQRREKAGLRIVSGEETDPLEFPFVVALETMCPLETFVLSAAMGCVGPWQVGGLVVSAYDADMDGQLSFEENCLSQQDFDMLAGAEYGAPASSYVNSTNIKDWYYEYLLEVTDQNYDGFVDEYEWFMADLPADLFLVAAQGYPEIDPMLWSEFLDAMAFFFAQGSVDTVPDPSTILAAPCEMSCMALMDWPSLPITWALWINANAPTAMPAEQVAWLHANFSLSHAMKRFLDCGDDMGSGSMGSGMPWGSFSGSGMPWGNMTGMTRRRRLLAMSKSMDGTRSKESAAKAAKISMAYCTGTLVASNWVLTAAHCVEDLDVERSSDVVTVGVHADLGRESAADNKACMEQFGIVEVLVHPGYNPLSLEYDVALLKLGGESSYPPVQLYDGGDLMFSDCKELEPVAVGWGETDFEYLASRLQSVKLEAVHPEECADAYFLVDGVESVDTKSMMCAIGPEWGMDTCQGDSGGPLLVPFPRSSSGWVQIGITSWGYGCGTGLPGVYTRVSEVLQWILGVNRLGMFPAQGLRLKLDELAIPDDTVLDIYKGMAAVPSTLLDSLDSQCDAGMTYSDEGEGGMLMVLSLPPLRPTPPDEDGCDLECLKVQGVRSMVSSPGCMDNYREMSPEDDMDMMEGPGMMAGACDEPMEGGLEGCKMDDGKCMPPKCELGHVTWENITAMAKMGKAVTGGLGMKAEKSFKEEFGVWACLRDWDVKEQLACGVRPGELACFKFEERSREFVWFGLNKDLKLVKPDMEEELMMMERLMIHPLPPVEDK